MHCPVASSLLHFCCCLLPCSLRFTPKPYKALYRQAMKRYSLAFVVLAAALLATCEAARELRGQKSITQGCNQFEVRAPNCPGSEICFFWRKAYSGCDNCVAAYHDACYTIDAMYTKLDGPRVNVEEAVFYRFAAKVIPGHPNQSYHLNLKYACIDGMLRATINC